MRRPSGSGRKSQGTRKATVPGKTRNATTAGQKRRRVADTANSLGWLTLRLRCKRSTQYRDRSSSNLARPSEGTQTSARPRQPYFATRRGLTRANGGTTCKATGGDEQCDERTCPH